MDIILDNTRSNTLLRNVYIWMTAALAVSGLVAFFVASTPAVLEFVFGTRGVLFVLFLAEFGLVAGLSSALSRISPAGATGLFMLYSILNGITLSSLFVVYELGSIADTFFIAAATFAVMAVYGSITKTDLTKIGNILLMALFGLLIAGLVNLIFRNSMFNLIVSAVGVLVFVGLTAYDSQKIKRALEGADDSDMTMKIAVYGALQLYLDFINIFLYLLRFFGRRK